MRSIRTLWLLTILLLGKSIVRAKLEPRRSSDPDLIELNRHYKGYIIHDGDDDFQWRQEQQRYFSDAGRHSQPVTHYVRQLYAQSPSICLTFMLSIAVFVAWQIPSAQPFLQRHFFCSIFNIEQRRYHTLLLASVSHKGFYHLLVNCMSLLSVGPSVRQALAPNPVWPLLLGASLSGSGMFLIMNHVTQSFSGGLGLSDVTCALIAFWARLYPERTLQFRLGPIPVTMMAKKAVYALVAWSLAATLYPVISLGDSVGHSAHLGGLLFGYFYYDWFSQQCKRRHKWKLSFEFP
ncbi:rhomboid-like protein [Fistulifera solaris]|uniref:Rhomboid-like protein n=1 Tax=Fistulifera solaris TaxID=1519565 RepID=A0A1Z5KFN1_FISSO|nr:rhomboid-like protein [Fistulifera solaris]|eukprot:GAX25124.1 rhomboid-like protein [Fistulifera solaris]